MDQCTFVFATRGHCIKGKQCQHVVLKNKISVCVQNNLACFPFLHYPLVANRKACWSITTKLWVKPLNQCNQMAILFFQYITIIFNNENLPSSISFFKDGPIPGIFFVYFPFPNDTVQKYKLNKCRLCAWDSKPVRQDGR